MTTKTNKPSQAGPNWSRAETCSCSEFILEGLSVGFPTANLSFPNIDRIWGMWVCKWRREWVRDLCIYTERMEAVSVGLELASYALLVAFSPVV